MAVSSKPLVTILTPTYNRADFLRETIDSVLAQTYQPIEYIVLDDGSSDSTIELLRSYGKRIRWESHSNMGETLTVNKGWAMASGDFIMNVNSDDPIMPELVAASVSYMQDHAGVVATYPDWTLTNHCSKPIQVMRTFDYDFANMVKWHHCFPGPGALIRRAAMELVGHRNPNYRYSADFEFWLRLARIGPFVRIPQVLATWRHHDGCLSNTARGAQMAEEHVRMMQEFFAQPGLPEEIQAVRSEALQSSCYLAAQLVATTCPQTARRYYLRSMLHRPFRGFSYPSGLCFSLANVGPLFTPRILRSLVGRFLDLARRALRRVAAVPEN